MINMKFVLHTYRRCPFCIRVRVLMYVKGFEYEVIEEPMRKWTGWMQGWAEENGERARVPVLRYVGKDGVEHILPESRDINMFLDSLGDRGSEFTPETGSESFVAMEEWITWHDDEMKPALDTYKYGENLQFDIEKNVGHTKELGTYLQKLEERLKEHSYLVDDRLTLADIAIIPFIRQIMRTREGEFDFTDFPKVLAWANAMIETDWFKGEVMKKYPLAEVGT